MSVRVCVVFVCWLLWSPVLAGRYVVGNFNLGPKCSEEEVCVEIRKCPFFDDLLNSSPKPRPRNVIKVIRENQCGFDGFTPKVCCSFPKPKPTTTSSTVPVPLIEDRWQQDLTAHRNYHLLPTDCGPIVTNSRITSGQKAALGEFPWMALIAYYTNDGLDFRCGGTVINDRYILTAAHCILSSTLVGIRLGEFNIETKEDCDEANPGICASAVQDFYIENLIVHPDYNPQTFINDIALIRLATRANFSNENVQPICLPVQRSVQKDLSGKFATVSGWGVTENGFKSSELLKTSIPVVPNQNCQRIYQKFSPITSNQICAGGYQGRDSCGGDSGGPLKSVGMVDGTPRFIQYGVVSYGPRHCGAEGQPGIYTKVESYVEWILDNLKPSED